MAMDKVRRPLSQGWVGAVISVAIALCVGAVGAYVNVAAIPTWYDHLHKPAFNPPNAVFGPVWTALYVLMALAAWRVWRAGAAASRRRGALILYAMQLALNLAWSLIFFGLKRPDWALGEIAALFIAVAVTGIAFGRIDRAAGWMMAPYAAWVAFAAVLNLEVWRLN